MAIKGTFDFDKVHYITEDHVKVEDGPIDVIGIFNVDITKYTVSSEHRRWVCQHH